jgi:hypothetical protein
MNPSPPRITSLAPGEIFVYGANEAGIHGSGAANQALKWGGKMRQYGFSCKTYGIPTKDRDIETLPLAHISIHIIHFIDFATKRPELTFLVTEIGCGLAGYEPKQIAPMFRVTPGNVHLPPSFVKILKST